MRTLIKNPTKLLIILERSNGERSIPEMDKVLCSAGMVSTAQQVVQVPCSACKVQLTLQTEGVLG